MKILFLLLVSLLIVVGCKEPIEYKYQDRELGIDCPGLDSKLAQEAYYSFRDDLAEYTMKNMVEIDHHNYPFSLALFVFKGAEGTADFKNIISPHTIKILDELKKETQLWDLQSDKSNLNYHSEFINCLIEGIKNDEVREAILSFRDVQAQNPKTFAELYRIRIVDADKDNYFTTFLAFEIYYQYLYDIEF
jgi:hypothetical protein